MLFKKPGLTALFFMPVHRSDWGFFMRLSSLFPLRHGSGLRLYGLLAILSVTSLAAAQTAPAAGGHGSVAQTASPARDANGSTPLITAAAAGDSATVKSLVSAGASVNATDVHGRTALIVAVESKQPETAKALVAAGADLNREANYIGSALNIAENGGDTELAAWLLAAGAKSTGKSVGDTVCVRSWGGQGYCGVVKSFTVRAVQIAVTRLVGCADGCAVRQECSAGNPVGSVNGLHPGEQIAVPSWCLTDTAVKQ